MKVLFLFLILIFIMSCNLNIDTEEKKYTEVTGELQIDLSAQYKYYVYTKGRKYYLLNITFPLSDDRKQIYVKGVDKSIKLYAADYVHYAIEYYIDEVTYNFL